LVFTKPLIKPRGSSTKELHNRPETQQATIGYLTWWTFISYTKKTHLWTLFDRNPMKSMGLQIFFVGM